VLCAVAIACAGAPVAAMGAPAAAVGAAPASPADGTPPAEAVSGEAAGAPPAATPPAGGDISRMECFARHAEAQVARRQGRLLEARAGLRLCSRAQCAPAIRADCVEWLDQVARILPSVVVTARARGADVANVKVFIDGQPVAERLTGAALDVDPGEHRFRFEAPPWPLVERTVLVSEGVQGRTLDVDFTPAEAGVVATDKSSPAPPPTPPAPAPAPAPRPRTVEYVLGGVALAGLGAFAAFGSSALAARRDLEQRCAPFCTSDEVGSVRARLIAADVALGVGIASLVAAIYLRLSRPDDPPAPGALSVHAGGVPGSHAALGVTGTF
jgi:hypothetical protein